MPKGLVLDIAADSRQAQKAIDDVGDALEQVGDSLNDVVKDSDRGTERMERDFRDMARDVRRESKTAYDAVKKDSKEATDAASDNVQSFKEEGIQNLSEFASSFKGDLADMADGVQGLTGGLASSLTPGVGIPIALLGAAAAAWLQGWADSTEEAKKRVSDMYRDMLESGQAFLSEDFVTNALADIIDDDGKRQQAIDDAKRLGIETATTLRAQAGDQAAINELIAKAAELKQAELDAVKGNGETLEQQQIKLDAINAKYGEILETYTGITSETQQAIDKVNLYREATGKAATADQLRWEALGRAVAGIPDQKVVGLTVDTSAAERRITEFVNKDRTIRVSIDGRSYGRY